MVAGQARRFILDGQTGSRGMVIGRARVIRPSHFDISDTRIAQRRVPAEVKRFEQALADAQAEMDTVRASLRGSLAVELGEILDAHALLLQDPSFVDAVRTRITRERVGAHTAIKHERDRLMAEFEAIDDPYLRSRSEDIEQVIGRVVTALYRDDQQPVDPALLAGEIIVADQVAPAELPAWVEHGVLGIVTGQGSPLSHVAILTRSLQLPMLCSVADAPARVHDGDVVLLDAETGRLIVHPDADDQLVFERWRKEHARDRQRLSRLRKAPTRTLDGSDVALWVNAERQEDIILAEETGAVGVGLFRTEFLFLQNTTLPDEDEQYQVYADSVRAMRGRPVTFRTLDIGADKADRSGLALNNEANPALGLRGVRLSLTRPDVFTTQLRAILRAAAHGPVRILVPMITHAGEMKAVRKLLKPVRKALARDGYDVGEHVELGAMIEIPAAAITIEAILAEADFVSIGTNDLAQYLLATDRNNDNVSHLYDPGHPALSFLIERVVTAARNAGKQVAVCGEIAGDPLYIERLLQLGVRDLSMHPGALLRARQAIGELTLARP
jgi:phosphotransferase system enzyme I (PtsI)